MKSGVKVIFITASVISFPFLCHFIWLGLKFSGAVRTDSLAPINLPVGRMDAYGPGYALFWASGGSIYKLRPETLNEIEAEGLDYFTDVKRPKHDGYSLSAGWARCEKHDQSLWRKRAHCGITPSLGPPNYGSSQKLWEAMETSPYYVGLGHGSQYQIIVSPTAEQIFIGWSD